MSFERSWHKSYTPGVPPEVEIEKITMPEILGRIVKEFPDNIAFIFLGRKITYLELDSLVNRFANALIDLGIGKGDKVGILLPNMPQIVIANFSVYNSFNPFYIMFFCHRVFYTADFYYKSIWRFFNNWNMFFF